MGTNIKKRFLVSILVLISLSIFTTAIDKQELVQKVATHVTLDHSYTWYKVCNPTSSDYKVVFSDDFNVVFDEVHNRLASHAFKKLVEVPYQEKVYHENVSCTPKKVSYPNGTTEEQVCENNGYSTTETRYNYEWQAFNPMGNVFEAETCYNIKVEGNYPFDLAGVAIDNVLKYAGYAFNEYDWWNATYFNDSFNNTDYIDTSLTSAEVDTDSGEVKIHQIPYTTTTPGIYHLWHFDNNANDALGTHNLSTTKTYNNSDKKYGSSALNFRNSPWIESSSYVNPWPSSAGTWEHWFRWNLTAVSASGSGPGPQPVGDTNTAGLMQVYTWSGCPTTPNLRTEIYVPSYVYCCTNLSSWDTQKWYHYAYTFNGSSHKVYIDSQLRCTFSTSKNPNQYFYWGAGDSDNAMVVDEMAFFNYEKKQFSNYNSSEEVTSIVLNSSVSILKATLTAQDSKPAGTDIEYYLSNNNGTDWYKINNSEEFTFPSGSYGLLWKANLSTTGTSITPTIYEVSISIYETPEEEPVTISGYEELVYDSPEGYDFTENTVNMTYDSLNRIRSKSVLNTTFDYSYDDQYFGTLANITADNFTVRYEYDDKLRVIKETKNIDGITFEKKYDYDSMDRVVRIELNPGTPVPYKYNNQGRISRIYPYVENTTHNAFDSPLNRTYTNNKTTEFSYDSENARLTRIKTDATQDIQFEYDNVGNVLKINDIANNRIYEMSYDYLDRLINATIDSAPYIYSYNEIGNILSIVRNHTNFTTFEYGLKPVHAPKYVVKDAAGVEIYKENVLKTDNKTKVYEFHLVNDADNNTNDISWSLGFGDGSNAQSSIGINLTKGESALVIVEKNYSYGGDYNVNITSTNGSSEDLSEIDLKFGVLAPSITILTQNISHTVAEFIVSNNMTENSSNVSWNCNNGISSSEAMQLSGTEVSSLYLEHNYSSTGVVTLNCTATSLDGNDSATTIFEIKTFQVEDFNITETGVNKRLVMFKVKNYYYPSNITWNISSDFQSSSNTTYLDNSENTTVSHEFNYTTDGIKTVLITLSSGNISNTYFTFFNLSALGIEDYQSHSDNGSYAVVTFNVKNYWPETLETRWNISNPLDSGSINLSQNESFLVVIEENYTVQGVKKPSVYAYTDTFLDSLFDIFYVRMVEISSYQVLGENESNSVTEMIGRSNIGSTGLSWQFDTGKENITSNQSIALNESEEVMIIIESGYTDSSTYAHTATINSSSYNDTRKGAVII